MGGKRPRSLSQRRKRPGYATQIQNYARIAGTSSGQAPSFHADDLPPRSSGGTHQPPPCSDGYWSARPTSNAPSVTTILPCGGPSPVVSSVALQVPFTRVPHAGRRWSFGGRCRASFGDRGSVKWRGETVGEGIRDAIGRLAERSPRAEVPERVVDHRQSLTPSWPPVRDGGFPARPSGACLLSRLIPPWRLPRGEPWAVYRPLPPQRTPSCQLFDRYFDCYMGKYEERFEPRYGSKAAGARGTPSRIRGFRTAAPDRHSDLDRSSGFLGKGAAPVMRSPWPASGEVDHSFAARRGWAHRRVELAQVERVPIPLNLQADDSPLFRRHRTLASWEKPWRVDA